MKKNPCCILKDLACCFFQCFALLSRSPSVTPAQVSCKFEFGIAALSGVSWDRPSMEQQQHLQREKCCLTGVGALDFREK